jgi:hypothetical protein
MMKQRQLGQWRQRHGQQRPLRCLRRQAVAALSAMVLVAALTVSAEARAPHVRSRPVAEPVHGRPAGSVGRSFVKTNPAKRPVAAKNGRAAVVSANAAAAWRAGSEQGRIDPRLAARRSKAETGRSLPAKLVTQRHAGGERSEARLVYSEPAAAALADDPKTLTVDDFTRAAEGVDVAPAEVDAAPASAIYAQGGPHPDDERPLVVRTPTVASRHSATKHAVVAKTERAPAYEMPTLPVGVLLSDGSMSGSEENDAEPIKDVLRAPTREELTEEVEQPLVLPGLYRNGRLVVPAPLKGTHEILVHQNTVADDEGLERIQDDDDLRRLRAAHVLVNFTETASLHVNPELSVERRCARVWTVRFAGDISRAFYGRFREPLQVNSAVRTVAYQVRLQRINGNAAGTDGEAASPHLTGQAIDLGKRGMSMAQIAWMRAYLLPLMQAGKLDVEEEFQQACFHISVYRTYLPVVPAKGRALPRTEVAQLHVPRVAKAAARVADESR